MHFWKMNFFDRPKKYRSGCFYHIRSLLVLAGFSGAHQTRYAFSDCFSREVKFNEFQRVESTNRQIWLKCEQLTIHRFSSVGTAEISWVCLHLFVYHQFVVLRQKRCMCVFVIQDDKNIRHVCVFLSFSRTAETRRSWRVEGRCRGAQKSRLQFSLVACRFCSFQSSTRKEFVDFSFVITNIISYLDCSSRPPLTILNCLSSFLRQSSVLNWHQDTTAAWLGHRLLEAGGRISSTGPF